MWYTCKIVWYGITQLDPSGYYIAPDSPDYPNDNYRCKIFSLKKTVMKVRPQLNGPIEAGYGSYTPSHTPDRAGRRREAADAENTGHTPHKGSMAGAGSAALRDGRTLSGKFDVHELLSSSNTLTHPGLEGKSEL